MCYHCKLIAFSEFPDDKKVRSFSAEITAEILTAETMQTTVTRAELLLEATICIQTFILRIFSVNNPDV